MTRNVRVFLLAVFTLVGFGMAIRAIQLLADGHNYIAFWWVFGALAIDMVDGSLARRYNAVSWLGRWLDTASDVVIYLLFPCVYWYLNTDIPMGPLLILVAGGIFRLVRYTIQGLRVHGNGFYFDGMPVYYIHVLLALSIVAHINSAWLIVLLPIVAGLMVSRWQFPKFGVKPLALSLGAYVLLILAYY